MNAGCINPLAERPPAERILVIRLGALGDVVRTLPAFAALRARFPEAHLTWLVEPRQAAALHGQPGIDEVLEFPRDVLESLLGSGQRRGAARLAWGFARQLRARRFDLVVDFHGILKSGLLARATGAPVRVGYTPPFARESAHWFANRRARLEPARVSRFVRNAALVDFVDGGAGAVSRAVAGEGPGYRVDPVARERMDEALGERAGPLAVVHPGSSGGASYKRYPVRGWCDVARALASRGVAVRIAVGPADEADGAAIVAGSDGAASLAPATDGVPELGALLACADVVLGNDSGPLHLAALAGTPVVQLLGPTDPVENAPWAGTPSRSLRVPLGCSPCRRGCAAATCMGVLPPAAAVAAAEELLAESEGLP